MYFLKRSILGLALLFLGLQASAQTAKDISTSAPKETNSIAQKADPAVIRHLHDLQKAIDTYKAAQQHKEAEKKQSTYNEYAAKNPLEAKIVADQKEQAEAAKNLSPAGYDDWKSNKHTPENK